MLLLLLVAERAEACGVWRMEDLERKSTVAFLVSSVFEERGGTSQFTFGLTDDLPAELLAWDRSAPYEDRVPTSMRWDWRADRGDTLSMDGTRVLRGGAVVGEWAGARELHLGDAAYTFSLVVDPASGELYGPWFDLVVTRDGQPVLSGKATSLCLRSISVDDQAREIRTRAAFWLAHTREPQVVVPRIGRAEPVPAPVTPPLALTVTASSTLASKEDRYAPSRLTDHDPATAWCEGGDRLGVGTTLTLAWAEPADPIVAVLPGYQRDANVRKGNGAPRRLLATTDTGVRTEITLPWPASSLVTSVSLHAPGSRRVVLELVEAWPGERWTDTCVSEIAVHPGG